MAGCEVEVFGWVGAKISATGAFAFLWLVIFNKFANENLSPGVYGFYAVVGVVSFLAMVLGVFVQIWQ